MKKCGLSAVMTEVYLSKLPNNLPDNFFDHMWPGKTNIKDPTRYGIMGDMFWKKIQWDIDDRWLDEYRKMREYEPRLVEVYGYEERKIYMKLIDGDLLRRNLDLDCFIEACDIMKSLATYAKENPRPSKIYPDMGFWFHHDMAPRNFMVENKTNKVYLIDPDTFGFWIYGQKESDIK